ncbi:malignant fibrous histiocytoma-amplified sequence 1 homolog [Drosophila obscura]|uniref:malignant fibrous histiocytoma-amplified sequence 1 homolog n=1 Tax=Drosophila obscura TaxID=7282 RepID=UPI000BA0F079|nr:malignant fibrous histiocytoma-amplified sequence 1 homolog [Drosophila obscura]
MDQKKPTAKVHPLYPKCEKARETGVLDLKLSELTTIPQAVFNFMSHAEAKVKECDISGNMLSYLQRQLVIKFQYLTTLNLSHNVLSTLPVEIGNLQGLENLDISCNLFNTLPDAAFKLPHLTFFYAQGNLISEFNLTQPVKSDRLDLVDLRFNPLSHHFRRKLMRMNTPFRLVLNISDMKSYDYELNDDDDDGDVSI